MHRVHHVAVVVDFGRDVTPTITSSCVTPPRAGACTGSGLCGALSTVSTYMFEIDALARGGQGGEAQPKVGAAYRYAVYSVALTQLALAALNGVYRAAADYV